MCAIPNVEQDQLSRAIHVGFISQLFEEAGEFGSEELAALARDAPEEEQQDPVLQARHDLPFRVQLILVRVVLQQDPVDEQIHHARRSVGKGRFMSVTSLERRWRTFAKFSVEIRAP